MIPCQRERMVRLSVIKLNVLNHMEFCLPAISLPFLGRHIWSLRLQIP